MLASQNIVIILCGNKKDLDVDREVTFLEASRFAQENGRLSNSGYSDALIVPLKISGKLQMITVFSLVELL